MNIRSDFPVVLRIEAAEFTPLCRDELLGLLTDYPVLAIHEDDAEPGIRWWVSFGEDAWQILDESNLDDPESYGWFDRALASLDVNWRRYPDLSILVTAEAGRAVMARFAASGVNCHRSTPGRTR